MTTNHPEAGEKIFKKGEVIYQQGDYVTAIFDVLWGQVALYVDYHKPTQRLLNEVEADGFFGIVGFLESRPAERHRRGAGKNGLYGDHS